MLYGMRCLGNEKKVWVGESMKYFITIAIILYINVTALYFGLVHDFGEPETHEPHEAVYFLLDARRESETYESDHERMEITHSQGESVSILADEDEVMIVITTDEGFYTVIYTLDQTLIRKHTKLYFDVYLIATDGWFYDEEAWGQDHNPDDYIPIEMSNEAFIDMLKELTMDDWKIFAEGLK